jgi:hypothetical protein
MSMKKNELNRHFHDVDEKKRAIEKPNPPFADENYFE